MNCVTKIFSASNRYYVILINNFSTIKKAFYFFLIVLFVFISLSGYALGKELPGNQRFLRVSTNSMEPSIKKDSIILIKRKEEYQENDVITYRPEVSVVIHEFPDSITHRIIGKKKFSQDQWYYQTKGDHNAIADGWIKQSQVMGKAILLIPHAISKLILSFLEPRWLRITALWLPLIFILITEVKNIAKEVLNNKKTKKISQ